MNKILKKLVLMWLLVAGGFSSCSILDVDIPDNLVKDDYWQTEDHVKASLAGVYTSLNGSIIQFIKWGDLRSGIYNYGIKDKLEAEIQLVRQDITTTNGLASWGEAYKSINWVNSFLENARSTMENDLTITEQEMAAWESEAYAIRALYYFYLVRTFKDVPLVLEAYESDLQAPYRGISPESVVLDTIEADLTRALAHAPESFTDPLENYGKITKNGVRAIWADVKLWRGDSDGCIALCEELERTYDNRMLKGTEWFTMFSQGNATETIFEYQYLSSRGVESPLYGPYALDPATNIFLSNSIYFIERMGNLFPSGSSDEIFSDTVRIEATISPFTQEVLKYIAIQPTFPVEYRGVNGRDANFIFYRFREILLIKAEALGMKGEYGEAVKAINKIRKATLAPEINDPANYGEGETFFMNLLDERIAELAYEGKQWFSLVRMARNTGFHDLLIERIVKATQYSIGIKPQTMRARVFDPESWFLPYLESEVRNNSLLEQKTYYDGK